MLASAGHGSRRGIEDWIRAGRVTINDRVAALGDRAETTDRICLDGKPLDLGGRKDAVEVLLYHKPVGEMTTRNDPEGRPTVFERLPPPKWLVDGILPEGAMATLVGFSGTGKSFIALDIALSVATGCSSFAPTSTPCAEW